MKKAHYHRRYWFYYLAILAMVLGLLVYNWQQEVYWKPTFSKSEGDQNRDEVTIEMIDSTRRILLSDSKDILSNQAEILCMFYGIVQAPDHASDEDLMKACFVLAFMDSNLKSGDAYHWMSKEVISAVRKRFQLRMSDFEADEEKDLLNQIRERDRVQYDELKLWFDGGGATRIGRQY